MHEFSLLRDLLAKVERIADEEKAGRVTRVEVRLGALAHISAGHFQEHFHHAVRGTRLESALLEVHVSEDEKAPDAQDIVLVSVEVE